MGRNRVQKFIEILPGTRADYKKIVPKIVQSYEGMRNNARNKVRFIQHLKILAPKFVIDLFDIDKYKDMKADVRQFNCVESLIKLFNEFA